MMLAGAFVFGIVVGVGLGLMAYTLIERFPL
jgi:F0F1-type ATP synthase assembly protein I